MKIRSRLGKKFTRSFRIDVFAFLGHEVNSNDPDENISWNLCPFAAIFLE